MKIINSEGIDYESSSNKELNLQRNKEQEANNQIANGYCPRTKIINYTKKNIDEKKRVELKDDGALWETVSIKDGEKKN